MFLTVFYIIVVHLSPNFCYFILTFKTALPYGALCHRLYFECNLPPLVYKYYKNSCRLEVTIPNFALVFGFNFLTLDLLTFLYSLEITLSLENNDVCVGKPAPVLLCKSVILPCKYVTFHLKREARTSLLPILIFICIEKWSKPTMYLWI